MAAHAHSTEEARPRAGIKKQYFIEATLIWARESKAVDRKTLHALAGAIIAAVYDYRNDPKLSILSRMSKDEVSRDPVFPAIYRHQAARRECGGSARKKENVPTLANLLAMAKTKSGNIAALAYVSSFDPAGFPNDLKGYLEAMSLSPCDSGEA